MKGKEKWLRRKNKIEIDKKSEERDKRKETKEK